MLTNMFGCCIISLVAEMRILERSDIVNILKLKGKIVEKGFTLSSFAQAIGMPYTTFFRRMEGDGLDFTIGEISAMSKTLELSGSESKEIFLPF